MIFETEPPEQVLSLLEEVWGAGREILCLSMPSELSLLDACMASI